MGGFLLFKGYEMNKRERISIVVIDVQNYFFKNGAYAKLRGTDRIIPVLNKIIMSAEMRGVPIVFTRQVFPTSDDNPMRRWWKRLPSGEESELFEGLYIPSGSIVIKKEYYSAFFETDLESIMRRAGVSKLFFCGVMTNLCVETSIREAFMRGFECFLIEDLSLSKRRSFHRASVLNLSYGFCKVIKSKEFNHYL